MGTYATNGQQHRVGRPRGDHDTRRQFLAEATWRTLRSHGLEGASLRVIAREADCTTGVILHYFEDKEELLRFAMTLSLERLQTRLVEAAQALSPRDAVSAMALVALPLDEASELQWQVWLTFLARSQDANEFTYEARRVAEDIRLSIEGVLAEGVIDGSFPAELDPAAASMRLVAQIDGLALRARFDPDRYSPSHLRTLVAAAIEDLCHQPSTT